jgi:hypothetical protein
MIARPSLLPVARRALPALAAVALAAAVLAGPAAPALPQTPAESAAPGDAAPLPGTDKASDRLDFSEEEWRQLYAQAVADAVVAEPHEIDRDLFPILEANPHLVRRDGPEGREVLAASWISSWKMARTVDPALPGRQAPATVAEAEPFVGETGTTPLDNGEPNYLWVTPVPQLREFCRGLGLEGRDLRVRLAQYLGLPIDAAIGPYAESRFVVELWVAPGSLFRPCADPGIADTACALQPGAGLFGPAAAFPDGAPYAGWFERQQELSYDGGSPFPWTRLGYTYDWGDSANEIGGSEYVIFPDAEFEIAGIHAPDAYCRAE